MSTLTFGFTQDKNSNLLCVSLGVFDPSTCPYLLPMQICYCLLLLFDLRHLNVSLAPIKITTATRGHNNDIIMSFGENGPNTTHS